MDQRMGTGVADSLLRKKEQKDEELDRRIVALRRKNQALLRRYQEIEEDRRQAEKGGMAVTAPRPPQADGLTITITKAHSEKRVVSDRRASSHPNSLGPGVNNEEELGEQEEEEDEEEEDDHTFTFRLGKRVQLAVTMENKVKGKRIVSTKARSQRDEGTLIGGSSLGSPMQIAITMEPGQKAVGPGSQELGRDYVRWKQEREQIDLARLARHRDAQGEWRRPWDLDKSKHMFQDASKARDLSMSGGSSKKGPRNYRKFQSRALPPDERGSGAHSGNLGKPKVPAMSSKARGKDRLTGRARRWDTKEGEEQSCSREESESQGSHNTKRSQNEEKDKQRAKRVEHSDQCGTQEPSAGLRSPDGHQRERAAQPGASHTGSSSEPRSPRKVAPVLPFFSPGDASGSSRPGAGASLEESSLSSPAPSEQAQKLSDSMAELSLREGPEQKTRLQEPREDGAGQAGSQGQPSQKSQPRAKSDKKSGEQD
ncbi:coiled-coil domain-containing protein 9B isoform X3 [Antechinus flavipes]|uniref:coiled-coil domain-containing protein 9B isoform X3 n=1 Tax=Antechinus flavipes TaxID=38775 RepID=UPI0022367EC5|nr:coiled-coil domain-containing protein 9B isoform X3 [Antechinus flavipes]